ncbi:MAG TPA: Rid family hydrolase [Acidimicrobiales bacterium]|nr:Rid family hydrolase [Acidimicrobiales bacterium]
MPEAFGPYSLWRRSGDLVVISGQLGVLPGHDKPTMVEGGAPEQLRQALVNARAVLAEAGATFDQVIKATLFLTTMDVFAACNEVWLEAFEPPRPTRSAVAVAQLPLGALAEIELWAHAPLD